LVDAAVNGETILIVADNERTVQLMPTNLGKKRRKFGSAAGLIKIAPDFHDPLADFAEYI